MDAEDFSNLQDSVSKISEKNIHEFIQSWNSLCIDKYMNDKGTYRKRKHATFSVQDGAMVKNAYQPHFQTLDYNVLNGGVERFYTEIDESTISNPVFLNLAAFAWGCFDPERQKRWFVEAHQFRIESNSHTSGKPTPEGLHRDGVDYLLMAMIKRQNISGGQTTIYDLDKKPLASFQLEKFLDLALVNDHLVFHGVSEICPEGVDLSEPSFRDVLVLTFKETHHA